MNRPKRRSILAVGVPEAGKTVLHKRITDIVILQPGYDGVLVFDRNGEWSTGLEPHIGDLEAQLDILEEDEARVERAVSMCGRAGLETRIHDGPIVTSVAEFEEYTRLLALEHHAATETVIPRRTIVRCGRDVAAYGDFLRVSCDQGHMFVVFSESPDWFTSYERDWPFDNIPGRPDVTLSQIYSQGRSHIPNKRGEPCPMHILTDSQDFMMVHWKVRKFSRTVLVGRVEGGDSYAFIRKEYGDGTKELVRRVRALELHEWIAVRGTMPELAPYRGGGRR